MRIYSKSYGFLIMVTQIKSLSKSPERGVGRAVPKKRGLEMQRKRVQRFLVTGRDYKKNHSTP